MDMEAPAAGTAQGDLADVVARAGAIMAAAPPSTSHPRPRRPPPPSLPAADHMSSSAAAAMAAGQIMVPYDEESRPACSDAVMFDPYLPSSSATAAPPGEYWLPPQQMALQISQHACYARDVVMAGAATDVDGDEAMRIVSPAAHQIMKSRKNEVKKVVCIPALPPTSSRPGGGEVIPSDLWAWRKYGQKPIKGSPYPRGYYRCSSSKGCMARKQVERSRSDPNMLVITYTAEHNHPWPMQRNVLAGYSRPHNNCKKMTINNSGCCGRVADPITSSPSKNNNASNYYSEHNNNNNAVAANGGDLEYCGHQQTATVEGNSSAAAAGYVTIDIGGDFDEEGGGAMHHHQPMITAADEVFAELEELEPPASNNPATANSIYSRGGAVSYEWHKFY